MSRLAEVFELASYVVVVLGVPTGVFQYVRTQRREREDHERQIFDAVSASYVEFQQLCLERPYLDVFDIPDERPVSLTPLQEKEEIIAFAVLFSIFERASLLYSDHPTRLTSGQWREWDTHIRGYFRRANFRRAWRQGSSSYDPRFVAYMEGIERQETPAGTTQGSGSMPAPPGQSDGDGWPVNSRGSGG
jgi:hypothetical protein